MTAYIIAQVDIHDPERYTDYIRMNPPSVAKYGGRYIARGGSAEVLEGDKPLPQRLVIIEFPSLAQAKAWWNSGEYRPARDLRQATSNGTLFLVDGVAQQ